MPSHIDGKFVAMGTLVGRTHSEIAGVVGPPIVDMTQNGLRSVIWGRTSIWSWSWQINLIFDRYGVCAGIGAETSF